MNEWYDDMTRVVLVRRIVTRKVIVNDNDDIDSIINILSTLDYELLKVLSDYMDSFYSTWFASPYQE